MNLESKVEKNPIGERSILIVDRNLASCTIMKQILGEMRIPQYQIHQVKELSEAKTLFSRIKIDVVICDDSIGSESAIELLNSHRSGGTGKDQLFFLLTSDTSQASIGRAAEEEIDGFVLKPFKRSEFKLTFSWVAQEKLSPSEYQRLIQMGREQLLLGNCTDAIAVFEKAIPLSSNPSTAYFYKGQAEIMQSAIVPGIDDFKQGLAFNQIHVKCLIGMFDALISQSKTDEAYEVLRRLVSLFPSNPKRLSNALNMAIKTQNFQDIENYYDYFIVNPEPTPELLNHMCSALAVNGKYHLMKNSPETAMIAFQRAVEHGNGATKYLQYIVETLTKYGFTGEAAEFVNHFCPNPKDTLT